MKMSKLRVKGIFACGLLFGGSVCFSAEPVNKSAHDPDVSSAIEEVLVTARRTEERLQDVPLSVTALSGEALQAKGIKDVNDLNLAVPGLSVVPANSPATLVLNIRGLGNQNPNGGSDAAVGFYVNEVPINLQIGTNL